MTEEQKIKILKKARYMKANYDLNSDWRLNNIINALTGVNDSLIKFISTNMRKVNEELKTKD